MRAMSSSGLTSMPAGELAELVRDRKVSPLDVVRAHLERIEALDAQLHAFALVLADGALAEAQALAERDDLDRLPLAGVPVAIKDNVDVRGAPTRLGSAATSAEPAGADDVLVARLRQAGCVVIGKTHMPELAIWPFTEPSAFPATRNPWDPTRTPGGSTGGGAAAVAAGMAALALGSDGGGSIRVPAACCGLFGLKPAPGLVPVAGARNEHWYGLTSFGPIARTVGDAAVALDVLTGTSTYRDPQPPTRPLRLAYSARHPALGARVTPAVRAALDEAVGVLRDAGHTVVRATPPYPANLGLRFSDRWLAGIADDAEGLPTERLEMRTQKMVERGRRVARKARPASSDPFAGAAARWLSDYDAFLTPTIARVAPPVGTWSKGWVRTMLGVGNWIFTTPWNLAGTVAASVPFGTDGVLPIGIQLVAPAGGEETVLALAIQLEQLHPWPATAPDPR